VYLQVDTEDERGLIRRCLDGDSSAFEPLVERYHRPLFRVAARMLGDREEAKDATQAAFLKAYVALPGCDGERRFFSWIYRIVVNECLNRLRSRRPMEPLSPNEKQLPGTATPGDRAEAGERHARIRQALLQLTAEQRDVIVMRHFSELSYDEIARELGIPEKTVKSRLFSARQRLCELLAKERV
jgi:RNA polymerase sigma-70 factor (ECF subfamily)